MTDADRLSEIQARLNAATPGPWKVDEIPETGECGVFGGVNAWYPALPSLVMANAHFDDAEFIAHARDDIPFLLAEVSRLSEKLTMRTGQTVAAEAETREYRAEVSRLSTVIEEVEKVHRPWTRYSVDGYEDYSYETAQDAKDATDATDDELIPFTICLECGQLETNQYDDAHYEGSLWPCRTAIALSVPVSPKEKN